MNMPYSYKDIIASFPFPSFRRYQREVIKQVYDQFSTGIRTVLLEAPTGFGKSPVNMAFALAEKKAFYATPLKQLQDQLGADFGSNPKIRTIKGRNNYKCASSGYKATCHVGECQLKKNFACPYKFAKVPSIHLDQDQDQDQDQDADATRPRDYDTKFVPRGCPYWDAKIAAINANVAISNFAYLLSEGYLKGVTTAPVFGKRPLLIVDEGHNIAEVGADFVSVTLSSRTVPESVRFRILSTIPEEFETFEEVKHWVRQTLEILKSRRNFLKDMKELTEEEARELDRINNLIQRLTTMLEDYDADSMHEWVWDTAAGEKAQFRPVTVGRFLKDLLWWRVGQEGRIIISSATILDSKLFAKEAGLPYPVSEPVRIGSTFPVARRPIIRRPCGSMTRDKKAETLPKLVRELGSILVNEEKGYRGIVHCFSYANLNAIKNKLGTMGGRLIYHENTTRQEAFEEWITAGGDKVFVCVYFEQGVDLKDDLARFQVIVKAPFPNLSDKRVRRRKELRGGQRWYVIQALKTLIQAYGRTTRSEDDWSRTYILDLSAIALVWRYRRLCPPWFMEAFQAEPRFSGRGRSG